MFRLIFATLIGAAIAYFFDPEKGEGRREQMFKKMEDKTSFARDRIGYYTNA